MQRRLVTEFSFPEDQVAVLSDVADHKPLLPTKATLETNIDAFLKSSRPSDRVLLVVVCHATVLRDKAYLLPIDAELPPEGAKADAERDARLAGNLIPLSWLYEKLAACPSRQKLLILDIAQHDPEAGLIRGTPGPLSEQLYQQIQKTPKETHVWLPCGKNQTSHVFSSSPQNGSVFLDSLDNLADLSLERNWKLIEQSSGMKDGVMPLVLLAPHVARKVSAFTQTEAGVEQKPELLGSFGNHTGQLPAEPPPPVALKAVIPNGDLISVDDVGLIIKELGIENDLARTLPPSLFPPMPKTAFAPYTPDYKNQRELEEKIRQHPLRNLTLRAVKLLEKSDKSFKMRIPYNFRNDANFKKMIEREQEVPAYITSELSELLEEMKGAEEMRADEPSKRWQAHFDYTRARLLAKLANTQEYGFVLGNKLRKDTPTLAGPFNGWLIVPQRKLEQKETRSFDAERQKIAAKIIKEFAGTPWEVLARREQATLVGLTLQEAVLDEGERRGSPQ